jgi:Lrp/AsnC family transcriptional regulator for asnA, asnC and gidA
MLQLDSMDIRILRMLQTEGRMPLTKLSGCLNVPHTTVRDRLKRLEEAGVIDRYEAVIDPAKVGFPVSAFVMVTLDQRLETAPAVEALMNVDEVSETYLLTGDIDVLVRIWARDVEHLRYILYQKLNTIPGLIRTNTVIVLDSQSKAEWLPIGILNSGQ